MEQKIIRLIDTDLDGSKKVEHALIKMKGISWAFARAVRLKLGVDNTVRLGELSDEQLEKLKDIILNPQKYGIPAWLYNRKRDPETGEDKHIVGSELDIVHKLDVKRLKQIKCYRGVRHYYNYKCRGQRTKSHGANVRGRVGPTLGVQRKKKGGKK